MIGGIQAEATEKSVGDAVERLPAFDGPLAWEAQSCHDSSCSSLPLKCWRQVSGSFTQGGVWILLRAGDGLK